MTMKLNGLEAKKTASSAADSGLLSLLDDPALLILQKKVVLEKKRPKSLPSTPVGSEEQRLERISNRLIASTTSILSKSSPGQRDVGLKSLETFRLNHRSRARRRDMPHLSTSKNGDDDDEEDDDINSAHGYDDCSIDEQIDENMDEKIETETKQKSSRNHARRSRSASSRLRRRRQMNRHQQGQLDDNKSRSTKSATREVLASSHQSSNQRSEIVKMAPEKLNKSKPGEAYHTGPAIFCQDSPRGGYLDRLMRRSLHQQRTCLPSDESRSVVSCGRGLDRLLLQQSNHSSSTAAVVDLNENKHRRGSLSCTRSPECLDLSSGEDQVKADVESRRNSLHAFGNFSTCSFSTSSSQATTLSKRLCNSYKQQQTAQLSRGDQRLGTNNSRLVEHLGHDMSRSCSRSHQHRGRSRSSKRRPQKDDEMSMSRSRRCDKTQNRQKQTSSRERGRSLSNRSRHKERKNEHSSRSNRSNSATGRFLRSDELANSNNHSQQRYRHQHTSITEQSRSSSLQGRKGSSKIRGKVLDNIESKQSKHGEAQGIDNSSYRRNRRSMSRSRRSIARSDGKSRRSVDMKKQCKNRRSRSLESRLSTAEERASALQRDHEWAKNLYTSIMHDHHGITPSQYLNNTREVKPNQYIGETKSVRSGTNRLQNHLFNDKYGFYQKTNGSFRSLDTGLTSQLQRDASEKRLFKLHQRRSSVAGICISNTKTPPERSIE